MKKRYLALPLFFLMMACNGQAENITEPEAGTPEEKPNLIWGKWNMDSSVFINDGVRGTVSAPLLPTTWTFSENGSYEVKNSMAMSGTFSNTDDSLFVVLMSVPNDYEILLLNDKNMQLRSTIVETDSMSMKTDAFLTRIVQ